MNAVVSAVVFQFHYGTIKTQQYLFCYLHHPEFQFHYGTIKTLIYFAVPAVQARFNSTMVRLRQYGKTTIYLGNFMFQFDYGTIKSLHQFT